jgi:hypothetical protein
MRSGRTTALRKFLLQKKKKKRRLINLSKFCFFGPVETTRTLVQNLLPQVPTGILVVRDHRPSAAVLAMRRSGREEQHLYENTKYTLFTYRQLNKST